MYKLPIDTQMGASQPYLAEIGELMIRDIIMRRLPTLTPKIEGVDRVYLTDPLLTHPPFNIDILLTNGGKKLLCTDMRPFMSDGRVKRMSSRDYGYRQYRSILTALWAQDNTEVFQTDFSIAGKTFVTLIVNRLNATYALDGQQQILTQIITAMYYGQLHNKGNEYTLEQAKRDVTTYANPALGKADNVIEAMLAPMPTIEKFVSHLTLALESPKFRHLNTVTFLTLMRSVAFFYKSEIEIAVAMEYPPVWVALVYLVGTDSSLRKSQLTNALIAVTKSNFTEFTDKVKAVIHPLTEVN